MWIDPSEAHLYVSGGKPEVLDVGDEISLRAQPPVQREPGQGRDHYDLAALGQAADPMLHEHASRGLLCIGEGGAQHEYPHHATPP